VINAMSWRATQSPKASRPG